MLGHTTEAQSELLRLRGEAPELRKQIEDELALLKLDQAPRQAESAAPAPAPKQRAAKAKAGKQAADVDSATQSY